VAGFIMQMDDFPRAPRAIKGSGCCACGCSWRELLHLKFATSNRFAESRSNAGKFPHPVFIGADPWLNFLN